MSAAVLAGAPGVRALYDELVEDIRFLAAAPPSDMMLPIGEIGAVINAEARLLDQRAFEAWHGMWDEDAWFWVPLSPDGHPGNDQSLFLDDHRRLGERVWRMRDTSAWALYPAAQTVRLLGTVEAWLLPSSATNAEVIASSALHITYMRLDRTYEMAARQIHRLRKHADGWHFTRKILLSPNITAGSPHMGWLL